MLNGRRSTASLLAVLMLALVAAGCAASGDDTAENADTTAATEPVDDSDAFIANEGTEEAGTAAVDEPATKPVVESPLSIVEIDFEAGTVTIANHSDDDVELGEIWICEFPDYEQLDAQTLAAGDSVTVPNPHLSSSDDGELALYRTDDFDDPDAMLSYLEWGSTGHTRSSVANEAGLWGTDAVGAGLMLGSDGLFAADATGWSVLKAIPGRTPASTPTPTTVKNSTGAPTTTLSRGDDGGTPAPTSPAGTVAPPPDDYSTPPPTAPPASVPKAPPPPDDY